MLLLSPRVLQVKVAEHKNIFKYSTLILYEELLRTLAFHTFRPLHEPFLKSEPWSLGQEHLVIQFSRLRD